MIYLIPIALRIVLIFLFLRKWTRDSKPIGQLTSADREFLLSEVMFYSGLIDENKARFEQDILKFLNTTRITGIQTEVTREDRLLVASSAAVPLFGFHDWEYQYLDEVLLYPAAFDRNFNFHEPEEIITGMVGSGQMEGIMILSKPALHAGFNIHNDKKNVGIHEFIHIYDKEDGFIDGLPKAFTKHGFSAPWVELIREKTREINQNKSDINDYGATAPQEFFAVAGEYFFEKPHLLAKKHPELYQTLSEVFQQDPVKFVPLRKKRKKEIGRNSPCPCGSGKKFKSCCIG